MTDQTKIPLPGATTSEGSLFERAGQGLGTSGLSPAPVPRNLPKPVNRRPTARVVDDVQAAAAQSTAPQPPRREAARVTLQEPTASASEPVEVDFVPTALHLSTDIIHPISRDLLARHGLIQPEAQVTGLLEEFRIVKRRVLTAVRKAQAAGMGAKAQRVLISSPLPDEGKTYCAANLAIAMAAEKDGEVLLVDADFAKPSILSTFGLPRGRGFMDVLANPQVALEDCILATDIPGLFVLPAGNHTNSDSEYLTSTRTVELLDWLTTGAPNRIVLFDSPPALAASPAAELAQHVAQAIVVARADRTGQSALEDALTLLSACPDIKLLLNAAHFSPSGRRFGAYYGQEA